MTNGTEKTPRMLSREAIEHFARALQNLEALTRATESARESLVTFTRDSLPELEIAIMTERRTA